MRYPVDNYEEEWNNSAGYDFGDATSYGFHDGKDINDNGGGDSDLGKAIKAIANGRLVYYHTYHPNINFGNHHAYRIEGPWGIRWVHEAHCQSDLLINVEDIQEGEQIARVGKSGTEYAHVHFSIFKVDPATLRNGIDTIAKTAEELNAWWEDPIAFIKKWIGGDSSMADMYTMKSGKQVDLANRDSNIVTANIFDEVINQKIWVKKSQYDDALNKIKELESRPTTTTTVSDPKADALRKAWKEFLA